MLICLYKEGHYKILQQCKILLISIGFLLEVTYDKLKNDTFPGQPYWKIQDPDHVIEMKLIV